MPSLCRRFWRDESGATAVEYGLICSGIVLAIIVGINTLGATTLNNLWLVIASNTAR